MSTSYRDICALPGTVRHLCERNSKLSGEKSNPRALCMADYVGHSWRDRKPANKIQQTLLKPKPFQQHVLNIISFLVVMDMQVARTALLTKD
jgi:hypothetical protein